MAVALILVLIISSAGCRPQVDDPEEIPAVEENPAAGGKIVFAGIEPKTLNPVINTERDAHHFLKLVFEGLVGYDKDLRIKPVLARDWTVSENGNSFTFNLREGLKWHDGAPVTAADVVFTLEYLKTVENTDSLYTTNIDRVVYFEALGDDAVSVVFDQWFNGALDIMTFPVRPSHMYDSPRDLAEGKAEFVPTGTGPYRVKEHSLTSFWVLNSTPTGGAGSRIFQKSRCSL